MLFQGKGIAGFLLQGLLTLELGNAFVNTRGAVRPGDLGQWPVGGVCLI